MRQNYQIIKAWKNAFTKQRLRVFNVIIIISTKISTRKDTKLNYCQRKVANNKVVCMLCKLKEASQITDFLI